jgi:enamine deaminase RidA (YjgF/YER057c/UK114 family)
MTSSSVVEHLRSIGITIPAPVATVANYVPGIIATGPFLFLSGQGTRENGVFQYLGKVGGNLSIEEGYAASRLCAINILAQIQSLCGLDSIKHVVKLTGFVNSAPDFTDLPKVLNGASDLMVQAFGDRGVHARSAIGVATLPFGMAVEVEAIFELHTTTAKARKKVTIDAEEKT